MKKYLWIILLVAVAAGFAYLGITVLTDGNNGPVLYAERLDGDEICDYYAINKKGEAVSANGYGCSSYIDCYGCTDMEITMMQMNVDSDYGLAFYDKNKNFISFVPSPEGDKQASVVKSIKVPRKAYYFRTTFFDDEKQKKYGEFACTLGFKTNTITEGKRPYQDGYIFFSQRVNQSMTEEEYKVTTGVVALPETYSQTGEKTPLLVYAHGLSHYVYYDGWGNTEEFRTQKQHWLDMALP